MRDESSPPGRGQGWVRGPEVHLKLKAKAADEPGVSSRPRHAPGRQHPGNAPPLPQTIGALPEKILGERRARVADRDAPSAGHARPAGRVARARCFEEDAEGLQETPR